MFQLEKRRHTPCRLLESSCHRAFVKGDFTHETEAVTVTVQALSLVEKVEPVQVRFFTLRWRDQRSMYVNARWMWSLHGFLRGIEQIMFHGRLDYFQNPSRGGRPNIKPGDHGTPNAHNRWFILLYCVWGPAWINIHWNSISLRGPVTYDFTLHLRTVTTLDDFGGVLGWPLHTFFGALKIS